MGLMASPQRVTYLEALESRYLKKTMTNDALRNILDALSLRIIKAIRFPFKGESGGAVCDSTPG